jgi:hypothetical protein
MFQVVSAFGAMNRFGVLSNQDKQFIAKAVKAEGYDKKAVGDKIPLVLNSSFTASCQEDSVFNKGQTSFLVGHVQEPIFCDRNNPTLYATASLTRSKITIGTSEDAKRYWQLESAEGNRGIVRGDDLVSYTSLHRE